MSRRFRRQNLITALLDGVIALYQFILSPYLGVNCRYQPSCSAYARTSLAEHGLVRGGGLALRRLLRCHPWGGHGYDPVPHPSSAARSLKQVTKP